MTETWIILRVETWRFSWKLMTLKIWKALITQGLSSWNILISFIRQNLCNFISFFSVMELKQKIKSYNRISMVFISTSRKFLLRNI